MLRKSKIFLIHSIPLTERFIFRALSNESLNRTVPTPKTSSSRQLQQRLFFKKIQTAQTRFVQCTVTGEPSRNHTFPEHHGRSTLRLVPADSATVPIDWSKVPEASKQFLITSLGRKALPVTIGELANAFNESKFFGYFHPELRTLLFDISEFGLSSSDIPGQTRQPLQLGPRFYMRYLEQIWFLIFIPGKRDGITGYSPTVREMNEEDFEEYEEYEKARVSEELEIAQTFDAQLKKRTPSAEASDCMLMLSAEIGGWQAMSFKQSLEQAQLASAMLSLPVDHPMSRAYMRGVFANLRR